MTINNKCMLNYRIESEEAETNDTNDTNDISKHLGT